jgi:hypothetical protein
MRDSIGLEGWYEIKWYSRRSPGPVAVGGSTAGEICRVGLREGYCGAGRCKIVGALESEAGRPDRCASMLLHACR